jgi:PAS domain S-box-containing protein
MVHPDDNNVMQEWFELCASGKHPGEIDFKIILPNGTIRCLRGRGELICGVNNKPLYMAGTVQDITDDKQAEQKLMYQATLLANVNDAIVATDSQYRITAWNTAAESLYGWKTEEVIGQNGTEIVRTEWATTRAKEMRHKIAEAGHWRGEATQIRKDGTRFPVEISSIVLRDEKGQITGYISMNRDITERKRTEEELANIRTTLEAAFEQTPVPMVLVSMPDAVLRIVNTACREFLGVTNEPTPIGQRLIDFKPSYQDYDAHGNKTPLIEAPLALALKGKRTLAQERRIVTKDGTTHWALVTGNPIYNAHNDLIAAYLVLPDITERKRAEEALRASEEKYRLLFMGNPAPMWVFDVDSLAFLAVNDYTVDHYGYSREEFLNMTLKDIRPPEDIPYLIEVLNKYSGQLRSVGMVKHCRKDGSVIDVDITGHEIEFEGHKAIIVHAMDVTERKRAEAEIRKLSNAVEQSGSSIAITNLKGEIEYVNPKFVELTGYSSQEALGKNPRILKSGETSSEEYKHLWETVTNGKVWRGEFHNKKKDGELYWESATISPIKDTEGKITHFLAVKEDITQKKAMAEQLRQIQKLEGLGTLAGGIAHDFNNILGIILAFNTSIKRFKDDAKKFDLATDTIAKAVDRGKTLVQQILAFARKSETSFGAVNVNDVVIETMAMIYEMFPKTVTCSQNFDKSIPYINADRSQIHQVLMNLSINARDAMPKGGVLTINTSMVSVESLHNLHPDTDAGIYVSIEVSDTGEGMTPETQKRIFEPFFTTRGIGKGTGLGLAVVFGIIQNHKGFIDVKSELGAGTTFQIYLPVSEVATPITEIEEETLEEIQGGSETLLIVEDEEMLAIPLQMALNDKGYKVIYAADGFAALKIYQEKKNEIALVLTDLGLPTISGLEVCSKIKQINPKERMILATGFLDPEMKVKFLTMGIEHILYKPYDLIKVLKVVREVLDEK